MKELGHHAVPSFVLIGMPVYSIRVFFPFKN